MNILQIERMLRNMQADYIGMGRKSIKQDEIIINTIMRLYCVTYWMDWQECRWLFENYVERGELNFPEAKHKALERIKKTGKLGGKLL